jgi:DNA excision repair protein ERCC-2
MYVHLATRSHSKTLCHLTAHIIHCFVALSQKRFARADKRSKLPRWMNQYITESASNLSTDMALVLSKHFLRVISQPQKEGFAKQSLWSLGDVEKAQAKQRELALAEAEAEELAQNAINQNGKGPVASGVDDEDMSDDGEFAAAKFGISEEALIAMDLDS